MPCYSALQTAITSIPDLEKAAKTLGIQIQRIDANTLRLSKDGEHIKMRLSSDGKTWETVPYSGSNSWPEVITKPLLPAYGEQRVKSFYKAKGKMVSRDPKTNQFVITSYR